MKVSIIIPTLNRANLLKKTIYSIVNQNLDYALYEIIVVDNGSIDQTKDIVQGFIEDYSELKLSYIFDNKPGLLTGRHRGAKVAKYEILAFIDDDVEVSISWLKSIINIMNSNLDVSLLTGPCLPKFETSPPAWLKYFWTKNETGSHCGWLSLMDFGNEFIEINPIFVWGLNFTIRKEVFLKVKGFHPDSMPKFLQHFQGDGETGLSIKAQEQGFRAYYSPLVSLQHFVPNLRMTKEYFSDRAYFQGVADAFTDIRRKNKLYQIHIEKVNPLRIIYRKVKRKLKFRVEKNQLPEEIINLKANLDSNYNEGYSFLNQAFNENSEVKTWILKADYLDK